MTKKIFRNIMLVSGLAIVMTFALITGVTHKVLTERTQAGLRSEAQIIASGIEMNGGRFLDETDFSDTIRVTWISRSGHVIYDSDEDPLMLGDHSDRQEFVQAEQNGSGSSSRYSKTLMTTTLNYALRLSDGTVIRVSSVNRSYFALMLILLRPALLILAVAALISTLFAMISSRRIVKPINEIDLDRPEKNECYRELSPLLDKLHAQNSRVSRQIEELRRNRGQLGVITESMTEGIVAADSKATVIICNSAASRLLGSEPVSEGMSIFALNRSDEFRRCIADAMGGRRSECVIKTDGGDREVIASPARSTESVNGVVVFIIDVTEKQQLEVMRREFTSNVSHELKTPLTTIYGISDMLANGLVKPEDVKKFGGDIRNESDRLITLINDIVSLSKLDEDAVPRETEDIDLLALSQEIAARLAPAAAEKKVTASVTGENVVFAGNRTVIDEIIYNLCDNAIKYNNDGGSYTVNVSRTPSKAVLTVSDTGMGIPQKHISRIFERFYRVDKSRSRRIKGTGLGLSIVKHGVMYHGGTVRAESSNGKGSVFTVELPIK